MSCFLSSLQLWSWLDRAAPELDHHIAECAPCRRAASLFRQQMETLSNEVGNHAGVPESIGPYRIVKLIGRGGMGLVYRAVQPATEQHVAVKVMWGALDGQQQFVRSFEREVRALGRMNHPNIARVLESGCTPSGQRYIAMELIEGTPIHLYAQHQSPTRTVLLRHFRDICDAIAHAHDRGVLHRDIKPSNIMIDARGTARVLDFGLARLSADPHNQNGYSTTTSIPLLGTLPYISPEQFERRGAQLSMQSDVYSLGVVLYELMTGRLPFAPGQSHRAVLNAICRGDWVRPRIAAATIDHDLAMIIETALENDPQRRYASAAKLRDDVTRYLASEPIEARAPSAVYAVSKAVQRHRRALCATVVVALMLLVGSIVSTTMFLRARRAEQLAVTRLGALKVARDTAVAESERSQTEARKARALSNTLAHIFDLTHPLGYKPNRLTHDALAIQIASLVDEELGEHPLLAADLYAAIGRSFPNHFKTDLAKQFLVRALTLVKQHSPDSAAIGRRLLELGELCFDDYLYAEAIRYCEQAIACYSKDAAGNEQALTLAKGLYGASLMAAGRVTEGQVFLQFALEQLRDRQVDSGDFALLLERAAFGYGLAGRPQKAYLLMAEAVALDRRTGRSADLAIRLTRLALMARQIGRQQEAEEYLAQALEASDDLIGRTYPALAHQLAQLADLAVDRDDLDRAAAWARRAAGMVRNLRPEHGTAAPLDSKLAGLAWIRGDYDEAVERYQDVTDEALVEWGPDSDLYLGCLTTMGVVLRDKGDFVQAESLLRHVYEQRVAMHGREHYRMARITNNLARLLLLKGDLEEAESLICRALRSRSEQLGPDHPDVAESRMVLGMILTRQGQLAAAHEHLQRALAIRERYYPHDHFWVAEARSAHGEWLVATGQCAEGRLVLEAALQALRSAVRESHRYIIMTKDRLAVADRCLIQSSAALRPVAKANGRTSRVASKRSAE